MQQIHPDRLRKGFSMAQAVSMVQTTDGDLTFVKGSLVLKPSGVIIVTHEGPRGSVIVETFSPSFWKRFA